ncbi:MAG TPA: FAD binding domain-containing protein [Polyangiaceae bacterium]|jgi:xanthine dehydrogenase small subunit
MGVRFTVNGEPATVDSADGVDPRATLLQWLRASGRVGTKEGCAEGECGACAVGIVARDARGRLALRPVNSCLVPLFGMAGHTVVTSEGIAAGGELHPVQKAMVSQGGSQCGYCTPGFVVSLFCEYYRPGRAEYDPESIGGNLCRCTGYRPIVDAARSLPAPSLDDPWLETIRRSAPALEAFEENDGQARFVRPTTLRAVFDVLAASPGATLIAGGTDLMVAANQRFARWPVLVALDAVDDLQRIERSDRELTIGAAVPLSHLEERMHDPDGVALLRQLLPLFSSRLIRNRATLGGNLATASPIGDSPPVLLALDAEVTLARAEGSRRLPLREFFLAYRKTALAPGELIAAVHVPLPLPEHQRFYKVSKRMLDDISTVAAAFALELDGSGRVRELRAAYGGVAATPLRVTAVEQSAAGKPWTAETLRGLVQEMDRAGTPMTDHRGSAAYRRAMLRTLLERFYFETQAAAGGEP